MPAQPPPTDVLKMEAQQVLDELLRRDLIPFKLTAYKVESIELDKYMIYFHDARLPDLMISWLESESFEDTFRAAMLERVSRMS